MTIYKRMKAAEKRQMLLRKWEKEFYTDKDWFDGKTEAETFAKWT